MKAWIMHDTQFGNGEKLAEFLGKEFSETDDITIGHVRKTDVKEIVDDLPDVFILGGAIRMFRGAPASKKFLKKLDSELEANNRKIHYATAFLTHGLPTDKVQGFGKRFLKKLQNASAIEKTYPELLTAQVEGQEGPIKDPEWGKAKKYIKDFIAWCK